MSEPFIDRTCPKLAFSREEAAVMLGVHPATIDRLTKRGLLRPSRATRRPIYPLWELERFLRDTSAEIEVRTGVSEPSAAADLKRPARSKTKPKTTHSK